MGALTRRTGRTNLSLEPTEKYAFTKSPEALGPTPQIDSPGCLLEVLIHIHTHTISDRQAYEQHHRQDRHGRASLTPRMSDHARDSSLCVAKTTQKKEEGGRGEGRAEWLFHIILVPRKKERKKER
ncbi:unnamed protein product [Protopolystoma xenopodis]|uniref:Uncharacterized protein n=1 Tax=Protopolystoma xenopodis TaxID=117903 RepID=A0A448XCP8_9PLAT|nr:unnamed protein product [Protopolystoma xenopodis]